MEDIFTRIDWSTVSDDKMWELLFDVTEHDVRSNCCDAPVIMGDICSECKEHCDPIEEEEED